jgi:hypothetical protein
MQHNTPVWSLLDRPPELVIGPAIGRTRWRTMTTERFVNYPYLGAHGVKPASDRGGLARAQIIAAASSLHGSIKHLGHVLPIDQMVHESLEVVGAPIAVIDIVGVLPNVTTKDRPAVVHQRILAVRRL